MLRFGQWRGSWLVLSSFSLCRVVNRAEADLACKAAAKPNTCSKKRGVGYLVGIIGRRPSSANDTPISWCGKRCKQFNDLSLASSRIQSARARAFAISYSMFISYEASLSYLLCISRNPIPVPAPNRYSLSSDFNDRNTGRCYTSMKNDISFEMEIRKIPTTTTE